MTTETLSPRAIAVADRYLDLPFPERFAAKKARTPYFNNRRAGIRGGLRVLVGKGTPDEIADEAALIALREHADIAHFDEPTLSRFMIDHGLGVDCSGLAYHVLDAESKERGLGSIARKIKRERRSIFLDWRARIRPAESTGVATLSREENSHEVPLSDARPGDFVSLISTKTIAANEKPYNHVRVIERVDRDEKGLPTTLYYVHSYAWPSDGLYGHGARRGVIRVSDPKKPLIEQGWEEPGHAGDENARLGRSPSGVSLSLRRLNWF